MQPKIGDLSKKALVFAHRGLLLLAVSTQVQDVDDASHGQRVCAVRALLELVEKDAEFAVDFVAQISVLRARKSWG